MKIIIIGCGRTGSGLGQILTSRGHSVTIVDKDPAAFERLGASFKGNTLAGVGFDRRILLDAGIKHSDGLAAVTNSDEANIVVARLARRVFRVPRVVARVYDPGKAEVYRRLGVHVVAHVTWGINRMAELICYSELDTIMSLGGGEVEIVAAEVPPLLVGRMTEVLTIPGEVHVVAIKREGKAFLPPPGTVLRKDDVAYLALVTMSVDRLKALLALQ
jgi:trk system potassium uptake protein TrkA